LASLKAEEPGMKIFEQTELIDYFNDIQFRTEAKTKKDVLLKLKEKMVGSITKNNTVYIGDIPYDRKAAEEIGISYIDVSEILGYSPNFAKTNRGENND